MWITKKISEPAIQLQLNSRLYDSIQESHLENPNFYASFLSRQQTYPSSMERETSRYIAKLCL
jgi:hypothetical protein